MQTKASNSSIHCSAAGLPVHLGTGVPVEGVFI